MRATGTLFLSRTRPNVQRATDGTFALQLHALDRLGQHQVEPWVVLWSGPEAEAFWAAHSGLLVPGAALSVEVLRMRSHVVGRALPEIHAVVSDMQLLTPTGDPMAFALAPVTVSALRHLNVHGLTSPTAIKAAKPEPEAAPAPMRSNAEIERAIVGVLERASKRPTLPDICRRIGEPEHMVRPSVGALVLAGTINVSNDKPGRYSLARATSTPAARHERGPSETLSADCYQGTELQRNPGIPDERFAAFDLPSRVGKTLRYPDGRVLPA